MKKIVRILLMLTCVFALTACGSEETVSEYQLSKISYAEEYAESTIECMLALVQDGTADKWLNEYAYNNIELKERFDLVMSEGMTKKYNSGATIAYDSTGKAVRSAFSSFQTGLETLGNNVTLGEAEYTVDDDTIIVNVPISGDNASGNVEVIVSNDIFYTMTSCTLNINETLGELMTRAGLNTLLGMGTVFVVLIIIIVVISAFNLIPIIQAKFAKKQEEPVQAVQTAAEVAVEEEEELSDDMELVAVIAAAIAAYEGTSTEGFQVRSIKRASTNKWKRA